MRSSWRAAGQRIVVTSTIQAAVDAAQPGDTVVVPPGVYYETVTITTSGLRLTGSTAAIIDASGFTNGVFVNGGAINQGPPPSCPQPGRSAARDRTPVPSAAGVRAQALDRNARLVDDFHYVRTSRQVHVLNAPSPTATAALEIGRHIAHVLLAHR